MKIGNRIFETDGKKTYVMGIVNVTPDSFFSGSRCEDTDRMLKYVEQMIKDGADIIDIGGESTRPGFEQISEAEEIDRVVPAIEKICASFDIPVSIDTYKATVAKEALRVGAGLVNDVWGLKYDPGMAGVIAESGCACCLMHNRNNKDYENFMDEVMSDLKESLKLAADAGIANDKIMLDPGVGFAKTYEMNLEVMRYIELIKQMGYPVLLGTSRKSVIGLTLNNEIEDRLAGTIATTVWGQMKGCSFVRVHDVKENAQAIKMIDAIKGGEMK